MNTTLIVIAAGLLAAIAIAIKLIGQFGPQEPDGRYVAKPLLTARERAALQLLEEACPQFRVLPQVAMGALLKVQGRQGADYGALRSMRNRFDRKIVDFVLVSRDDFAVRYVVELDDASHDGKADKDLARDQMLQEAGYRTVRIPKGRLPGVEAIRASLGDGPRATAMNR